MSLFYLFVSNILPGKDSSFLGLTLCRSMCIFRHFKGR